MHWIAVSKIEAKLTVLKRLFPEYHYTMFILKCIVEIHAANEHFLICRGYYYGVDTYWSLWKRIQKGRRGLRGLQHECYPTPSVSGHVSMAACGAVHKHTGLLSTKSFFYSQTGVERPQPTPVPDRKIHPNIYIIADPALSKWFGLDDLQRCLHTSGILG